jgi:hypothetical protein
MRVFTLTGACLFLFLCPPAHGQTSAKAPCGDPKKAAEDKDPIAIVELVGKQELIQKCPCEKSDDIEQVGSSEANLIWVSNDKSASMEWNRTRMISDIGDFRPGTPGRSLQNKLVRGLYTNDGSKLSHSLSRESSQRTAVEVEQQPAAPKTEPVSLRGVRPSEEEQGHSLCSPACVLAT